MKVAVATAEGQVSEHFGRAPGFTIADVDADGIKNKEYVSNAGGDCQAVPLMLGGHGVEVAIVGGIGGGAVMALQRQGIQVMGSVSGDIDQVFEAYRDGSLTGGEVGCNHHDAEHKCGH